LLPFPYTGSDGPPPVVVDFKNESETIIQDSCSYLWTFGQNGPNSSDKDPSFTFNNASSSPKIYLVTLKVTDLVSGLSHTNSAGVEIQGRTGGKQE
jgi:PKD repeat protein